jgi:hypothetical protein
MQAGDRSLETALIRILALVDEVRPTGEFWHTDLIRRAGSPAPGRPEIPSPALAQAADRTRRFRHVAVRTCDAFDTDEAVTAVTAAAVVARELPVALALFHQAIDP